MGLSGHQLPEMADVDDWLVAVLAAGLIELIGVSLNGRAYL